MHLPDELLLAILKYLNNVDLLYFLMGLNTRLDRIIRDPCFTTLINLIRTKDKDFDESEMFTSRFSATVLPKIHHLIRYFKLDSTSMERILGAADYPNLSQLDIFIPHVQPVLHLNGEKIWVSSFNRRSIESMLLSEHCIAISLSLALVRIIVAIINGLHVRY